MNTNGGKSIIQLVRVSAAEPKKTLKPILPKLKSTNFIKPKRSYQLHPEEAFNGYGTCYVCDALFYQGIRLWGAHTAGTGLATKIGQLLGDKYAVVVNADDVLCQKCFSLLIHIDTLEDELRQIRDVLRGYLITKYNIDDIPVISEGTDGQEVHVENSAVNKKRMIISDAKKPSKTKTIQKCSMCDFQVESLRALRRHNIKVHLTTWTCHFCNQVFQEEKMYTDHTKLHLTDNSIQMAVSLQQTIENAQLDNLGNQLSEQLDEKLCNDDGSPLNCNLCGVDFNHEDAFNEHMQTHQVLMDLEGLDKPEALSLDGFGANTESVDLMDMNIFDNSDPVDHDVKRFLCASCDLAHETQEEMTMHMHTVHHISPCYLCHDFFGSKPDIEAHIAETHANETDWLPKTDDKNTITCGFCNIILEEDECEIHAQECQLKPTEPTEGENVEVLLPLDQEISEAFIGEEDADEEQMSYNGQAEEEKQEILLSSKTSKKLRHQTCIHCGQVFDSKQALAQHELANPTHLGLSCPDCNLTFVRDRDLNSHREILHSVIHCRWCPKSYKNIRQIKTHEARHVRALFTTYECEVCHRIFQTPTGLRHHMLNHTGDFKYKCEFCGKGFGSRVRHEEHRATHTKEKRYTCDICDAKFSVQATYWIHRKWHDNPKPYQCQQCGLRFKHSSLLSVHKRKHTGQRPYACPYCEQTFAVSNSLKRHLALHTGTYPYSCETCNVGFPARHKYAQHMSKVHNDNQLLLEQLKRKSRDMVMAVKEDEVDKPQAEETWVLADGLSESDHYLTLETEGGEKILLAGDNQIQIIYRNDQNVEGEEADANMLTDAAISYED